MHVFPIGYGTFTRHIFMKNEFLLEYRGEHISMKEALKREREYPPSCGSYMYFFKFDGKAMW